MGNEYSHTLEPKKLYNQIQNTVKEIIYKYQFWTDPNICDKLSVVYYDKLIKFHKDNLLDISAAIGIKHESDVPNDKLCTTIIDHFKNRINFLKTILLAIDRGQRRIVRATKGPICRNVDAFVEDFFTCQQYSGLWISQDQYKHIVQHLKEKGRYDGYKSHFDMLEKKYCFYLRKLLKVIDIIKKDIDNTITDNEFDKIRDFSMEIIKKMDIICDIAYLLIINFS